MKHRASVIGYYGPDNKITIAGTGEDIRNFAEELSFTGEAKSIMFYVPDDSPAPFEHFLKEARLRKVPGLLGFSSSSDALVITGPTELCQQLACTLLQAIADSMYEGNAIQRQIQLQHSLEHPFIAVDSLTLVVTIIGYASEPDKDQASLQNNADSTKSIRISHLQIITDHDCPEEHNSGVIQSSRTDTTPSQRTGS